MDVLVTGADGELGRELAHAFRSAGHRVAVGGAQRGDLEVIARELDAEAIVCDFTDAAELTEVRADFPPHLDAIVITPAHRPGRGDHRGVGLAEIAADWRGAFDRTLLPAVLIVHAVGENIRSGGSVIVCDDSTGDDAPAAAAKAALAAWTAGQAAHLGPRGITINAISVGRPGQAGYPGLSTGLPPAAAELSRLALFLTTPPARRITGQLLHAGRGAVADLG